jgi:hypothetical protein
LIVVVVYSNVAVMLNYPLSQITPRLSLPSNRHLDQLFILFGVFFSYETMNRDVEIYGITAATASSPEGEIIKLDTADYFPFSSGEFQSRSMVARHAYLYGEAGQRDAWESLAAKIRGRYNRSNPATPIERVVIVLVNWPRSLQGYETLKTNETLNILFAE